MNKEYILSKLKEQSPEDYENPKEAYKFCAGYNACVEYVKWLLNGEEPII